MVLVVVVAITSRLGERLTSTASSPNRPAGGADVAFRRRTGVVVLILPVLLRRLLAPSRTGQVLLILLGTDVQPVGELADRRLLLERRAGRSHTHMRKHVNSLRYVTSYHF